MPLYKVTTRSTVWRSYEVRAANEKEAEAKSCEVQPYAEEDENTETMEIALLPPVRKVKLQNVK